MYGFLFFIGFTDEWNELIFKKTPTLSFIKLMLFVYIIQRIKTKYENKGLHYFEYYTKNPAEPIKARSCGNLGF
jgi:hypothetical protein